MTATDQQALEPGLVVKADAPAQSLPVTVAGTDPLERQGLLISAAWIAGTWRRFRLVPRAQ